MLEKNNKTGPYNRRYLAALRFFRESWETGQPRYKNNKNKSRLPCFAAAEKHYLEPITAAEWCRSR